MGLPFLQRARSSAVSLLEIPAKRHGPGILQESKPLKVQEPKEEKRRKRVYKTVTVVDGEGAYGVALDGRSLHTPSRAKLESTSRALAEAVAEEWDAQTEFIDPACMPLTRLLNTSVDRIAPNVSGVIDDLMFYVDSDLLCYRAETPSSLIERQEKVWQPILDCLSAKRGIALSNCAGLMPHKQSDEAVSAMRRALESEGVMALTAFQGIASLTGSMALGLALIDSDLTGVEVTAAAYLDETWQMEQWGEDKEALARKAKLEIEISAVEKFLGLSRLP